MQIFVSRVLIYTPMIERPLEKNTATRKNMFYIIYLLLFYEAETLSKFGIFARRMWLKWGYITFCTKKKNMV